MLELKTMVLFFLHPISAFYVVKRDRKQYRTAISCVLYLLAFVAQYVYILAVHYPLSSMRPYESDMVLEFVKLLLPVLTWVIASYGITSISGGETKFKDVFNAGALCLLPVIVFKPILALLSRILAKGEQGLFDVLYIGIIIWVILSLFIALLTMNDYRLGQAIGITLLSIISMLVLWAVALLIYALSSQLVAFFNSVLIEIRTN